MTLVTLRIIFDHLLELWLTGKEKEKLEIQKFEYFENKESFLNKIKIIFHNV